MWSTAVLLVLVAIHISESANSYQLPSTFPRCKRKDPELNECLKKAVQVSLPQFKNGVPSLQVPPLDPLQVTKIEIGQGSGPISINMKFTNISVGGLSNAIVRSVDANLDTYVINCDGMIADTTFEADYEMTGRILLLPVTGKGRCKLTFKNLQARLGLNAKNTIKKGKKYFDMMSFPIEIYSNDKLTVHFENLFNGDKTLGNSMNNLLNENWKDLWNELRPAFEQTFSALFLQYSKGVFDKVSFGDVILE